MLAHSARARCPGIRVAVVRLSSGPKDNQNPAGSKAPVKPIVKPSMPVPPPSPSVKKSPSPPTANTSPPATAKAPFAKAPLFGAAKGPSAGKPVQTSQTSDALFKKLFQAAFSSAATKSTQPAPVKKVTADALFKYMPGQAPGPAPGAQSKAGPLGVKPASGSSQTSNLSKSFSGLFGPRPTTPGSSSYGLFRPAPGAKTTYSPQASPQPTKPVFLTDQQREETLRTFSSVLRSGAQREAEAEAARALERARAREKARLGAKFDAEQNEQEDEEDEEDEDSEEDSVWVEDGPDGDPEFQARVDADPIKLMDSVHLDFMLREYYHMTNQESLKRTLPPNQEDYELEMDAIRRHEQKAADLFNWRDLQAKRQLDHKQKMELAAARAPSAKKGKAAARLAEVAARDELLAKHIERKFTIDRHALDFNLIATKGSLVPKELKKQYRKQKRAALIMKHFNARIRADARRSRWWGDDMLGDLSVVGRKTIIGDYKEALGPGWEKLPWTVRALGIAENSILSNWTITEPDKKKMLTMMVHRLRGFCDEELERGRAPVEREIELSDEEPAYQPTDKLEEEDDADWEEDELFEKDAEDEKDL